MNPTLLSRLVRLALELIEEIRTAPFEHERLVLEGFRRALYNFFLQTLEEGSFPKEDLESEVLDFQGAGNSRSAEAMRKIAIEALEAADKELNTRRYADKFGASLR